jgi:hypothetical protein
MIRGARSKALMFGECYAGMACDEMLNLGTWLLVGEIVHASVRLAHEPLGCVS